MPLTTDQKTHLREISLDQWERGWLRYLAEHGGECRFDFRTVRTAVEMKMRQLADKGVIELLPYGFEGPCIKLIRLTDQGRSIVSYLESLHVGRS